MDDSDLKHYLHMDYCIHLCCNDILAIVLSGFHQMLIDLGNKESKRSPAAVKYSKKN